MSVAFTMAQVRQGALGFQRQLSAALREVSGLKVYSASPFDLEARRQIKDRFGGDVVYFFRQRRSVAGMPSFSDQSEVRGRNLEEELPRRRAVVVGLPDSNRLSFSVTAVGREAADSQRTIYATQRAADGVARFIGPSAPKMRASGSQCG